MTSNNSIGTLGTKRYVAVGKTFIRPFPALQISAVILNCHQEYD